MARRATSVFGSDAYPTIHGKAAALLQSLACKRPLVDGNKRLALLVTYVFFTINGQELDATQDEVYST